MHSRKAISFLICLILVSSSALFGSQHKTSKKAPSPKHSSAKTKRVALKSRSKKKGAWKRHGQQNIADDRTREIQAALIGANYLSGQPTGTMDVRTKEALVRYQADNGWQKKVVPDSRALIKLGLGPDHSHLLNPNTAALPASSSVSRPIDGTAAITPQR